MPGQAGSSLSILSPPRPLTRMRTCGPEVSELVQVLLQVGGGLVFICVRPGGITLCPRSTQYT